ncbi:CsgG/HfaB family protein [Sphingomonas bacterium]|uniref:CsgG/HfaB family protein n=1 Tax=Sphingomonas bacterium TaxID=1895847 RepID=UPI002616DC7A|nr:CsgG/HfaB family protein [Sphingomonas bacterium]
MRRAAVLLSAIALSACSTVSKVAGLPELSPRPVYPQKTATQVALEALPPPSKPVAIAVYGFTDQTGQFKPSDTGQTLSRAVSQGGGSILVKALQDAGQRRWFTIVERESLKNLLNERQIIREMRERYLGETNVNAQALPALLFAGVLLEGGIIGYDSNTVTGGAGAGFLGISAKSEYRQDTVTVYLRAVSVRTGEVLTTVTASKTIASRSLGANVFAFVGFKQLLEAELGVTTNEPDQIALQQAIEKALYGIVLEGVDLKLWSFADPATGAGLLQNYHRERDGNIPVINVAEAIRRANAAAPQKSKPRAMLLTDIRTTAGTQQGGAVGAN